MIDPPSGWRYGFPRPYLFSRDGPMDTFLLENGYPIDDLEFALAHIRIFKV